jgi:glutamate/tyrosine decarboxylase-like PLP-dependent enzyme
MSYRVFRLANSGRAQQTDLLEGLTTGSNDMNRMDEVDRLRERKTAVDLLPEDFRAIGHRLVDTLADFLGQLPARPVTRGETPSEVRRAVVGDHPLPDSGTDPAILVSRATELLMKHSLFNGHPRFFGYITSSATPIGAFADFIAATVNCNVGAWKLAPAATEIEAQAVRWIAEFTGYPSDCGGLLVSGGNMANLVCFLAARAVQSGVDVRQAGVRACSRALRCYCSAETHTWIQKAADISGLGTDAVRWIRCDSRQRLDLSALRTQVDQDRQAGDQPFLVVGTAGSVSTGAVDPLADIAAFCRDHGLWFHVDGAYGGFAANVPGAPADLRALEMADSVAVDPHKWLYAPVEAGCALVRNPMHLRNAFSYRPSYYNFDTEGINYYDLGPQNSRGFRALKIWLAFQQAGRAGYLQTIGDDIALSQHAFAAFRRHPDFEAVTQNLSISTFRYVPGALRSSAGTEDTESLLNRLNQDLLSDIEKSGEAFLSNAIVEGKYLLRMCIVNFRTSLKDIESLPELIAESGARTFATMQNDYVTGT